MNFSLLSITYDLRFVKPTLVVLVRSSSFTRNPLIWRDIDRLMHRGLVVESLSIEWICILRRMEETSLVDIDRRDLLSNFKSKCISIEFLFFEEKGN